jgi:hypothetical protein
MAFVGIWLNTEDMMGSDQGSFMPAISLFHGAGGEKLHVFGALPLDKLVDAVLADIHCVGVIELQLMEHGIIVFDRLMAEDAVHAYALDLGI